MERGSTLLSFKDACTQSSQGHKESTDAHTHSCRKSEKVFCITPVLFQSNFKTGTRRNYAQGIVIKLEVISFSLSVAANLPANVDLLEFTFVGYDDDDEDAARHAKK